MFKKRGKRDPNRYSKERLEQAVAKAFSFRQAAGILNLNKDSSGVIKTIKKYCKKYQIDTTHFKGCRLNILYSLPKEYIQQLVNEVFSFRRLGTILGYKEGGGSIIARLKKYCKEYKIDTSHFLGMRVKIRRVRKWKQVLINPSKTKNACMLRRALLESGRSYKCQGKNCKVTAIWKDKELRLHIHHINTDKKDNRPENLLFLCPNCHSQTETYCYSKGMTGLTALKEQLQVQHEYNKHEHKLQQIIKRNSDETGTHRSLKMICP